MARQKFLVFLIANFHTELGDIDKERVGGSRDGFKASQHLLFECLVDLGHGIDFAITLIDLSTCQALDVTEAKGISPSREFIVLASPTVDLMRSERQKSLRPDSALWLTSFTDTSPAIELSIFASNLSFSPFDCDVNEESIKSKEEEAEKIDRNDHEAE